jgi:hypothetical protein
MAEPFTATAAEFGDSHWQAMWDALYTFYGSPPACPACKWTGFYGPRKRAGDPRHYRMCKFCGFFQNVGEDSEYLVPTVPHQCPDYATVLEYPYIQWAREYECDRSCDYCGVEYSVSDARVQRPADGSTHPWRQMPQAQTYQQAIAYWASLGQDRLHL